MKSFLILSLFCAFALGLTVEFKFNKKPIKDRRAPFILHSYQENIKNHFKRPENANLLMSFLFGAKQGISPHTKKAFEKTNLSFLLSPSGIHLTCFFIVFGFLINRFVSKKKNKLIKMALLILFLLLPTPQNIKRLSIIRLGAHAKPFLKKRISLHKFLILSFGISFLLGHYFQNPLSYLLSLLFIGTFFLLSEESRVTILLALFSNQILINLFLGNKISLFSVFTSVIGVSLFTLIQPVFIMYFLTFWIYPSNWVEPLISLFVKILKLTSIAINGTFTSSSIFLLLAIWCLLFIEKHPKKISFFALFLLLHCNTSMAPCFFRP